MVNFLKRTFLLLIALIVTQQWAGSAGTARAATDWAAVKDYEISVDVNIQNLAAGICFADENNGVTFSMWQLSIKDNKPALNPHKWTGGVPAVIKNVDLPSEVGLAQGKTATMRIVITGGTTATTYVNGVKVDETSGTYPLSRIGLRCSIPERGYFDNLKVVGADGTVYYSEDFEGAYEGGGTVVDVDGNKMLDWGSDILWLRDFTATPFTGTGFLPVKLTGGANQMNISLDDNTGVYTIQTQSGNDPYVYTEGLSRDIVGEGIFYFEYQCDGDLGAGVQLYLGYPPQEAHSTGGPTPSITKGDEWKSYSVELKYAQRGWGFGKQGDVIRFDLGVLGGVNVKLRNVGIKDYKEKAYAHVDVTKGGETIVEAENFDTDGIGQSYQSNDLNAHVYTNPTGNEFPILAWFSILGDDNLTQARYQELANAGFNISFSHFTSSSSLAKGLEACKGTGVKIMAECPELHNDDIATAVTRFKDDESLCGWFTQDEPTAASYPALRATADKIRAIDDKHLIYGNLLPTYAPVSALGTKTYTEYMQRYLREVGTGLLSYDHYPVIASGNSIMLREDYYENLTIANKVAKQFGVPFWAFALSTAHDPYPVPTAQQLRLEVFSGLAFGAQGIQYFTYWTPLGTQWNFHNAPIDENGNRTNVYDLVKTVNAEVKNLTPVFLGASTIKVGFMGSYTPDGADDFGALPAPFSKITATGGENVLLSQFQNGSKQYFMLLNSDLNNAQTVTITTTAAVARIMPTGETTQAAGGEAKLTLQPGDYLIYELPATNKAKAYKAPSNYRQATNVTFVDDSNYDNGSGIANMGGKWNAYNLGQYVDETAKTISRDMAQRNWGAWYEYTINVPEDIDVNISVRHAVNWSSYGQQVATGLAPGTPYAIQNEPALNWPQRYAGAMTLALDGIVLATNQKSRPVAPSVYDASGKDYNATVADLSKWTSTLVDGTTPSDTLWLYPEKGGTDNAVPYYHATPDYMKVHLTAGNHVLRVTSLSGLWNFDCLKLADSSLTAVESVIGNANGLVAYGTQGTIIIKNVPGAQVYNINGAYLGHANGKINVPAGMYMVRGAGKAVKVLVK